ncbi:MAG: gliding motility-associated C-terminal domain-containing protein, partial [Candidatus Fermentibacteria bacterium]
PHQTFHALGQAMGKQPHRAAMARKPGLLFRRHVGPAFGASEPTENTVGAFDPPDQLFSPGSGRRLRDHPDFSGYESSNWTGCSSGGTPGAINSCSAGESSGSGKFLDYYPDPFSPDGDGRDDILTIEMNFQHPENEVTLEIYNVQGRLLLQLLQREICGLSKIITWNGTGENGERLPVGRYIIYLNSRAEDTGEYRETCDVLILARPL